VASLFVLAAIVIGFIVVFLGVRRSSAPRRLSAEDKSCAVVVGTYTEVYLTRQTLQTAGIWSLVRDVSRTAYSTPQELQLWVKEKDAEHARGLLGLDSKP
jgi:hypothetical protein